MRYSEAVKRHKLETKQRILNSILEAAEREKSAARSLDNGGNFYRTRETDKKETITMRSTQLNEVKSRKGGLIAAACAALIIGGIGVFAKQGALPIDDIKTAPATATSEAGSTVSGETASAVSENAVSGTESTADAVSAAENTTTETEAAVTDAAKGNVSPEISSEQTTTSAPDTTASSVVYRANFAELLDYTSDIVFGRVKSAEPMNLNIVDEGTKYVIKYTLTDDFFKYDVGSGDLYDYSRGDSITVYQFVENGAAPQFKAGETALFMTDLTTIERSESNSTQAYLADVNGAFIYTNHQFCDTVTPETVINNGLNDYIMTNVLNLKDEAIVMKWLSVCGVAFAEKDVYSKGATYGSVMGIEWNEAHQSFDIEVNRSAGDDYDDSNVFALTETCEGYVIAGSDRISNTVHSGFGTVDLRLENVVYYADNTAVALQYVMMPKEGTSIKFNDKTNYKLSYDLNSSGLNLSGAYFNTDALLSTNGVYGPSDGSIHFTVVFDQAGTEGEMDFDTSHVFDITIDGVLVNNDAQYITGNLESSFTIDGNVARSMPKARVIDPDTPLVNADYIKTLE